MKITEIKTAEVPIIVDGRRRYLYHYVRIYTCLLYTSPSPRDATLSRMPSSA